MSREPSWSEAVLSAGLRPSGSCSKIRARCIGLPRSRTLRGFARRLPAVALALLTTRAAARERVSINNDWRFTKGDPTNSPASLLYDVRRRETVRRLADAEADGNAALNEPGLANESTNAKPQVIKPWILPSGNEFLKDASR